MSAPFSFRLWLFAALREKRMTEREFAKRMSAQLGKVVPVEVVGRVLDGKAYFSGTAMLAAAIVTGISLQPNLRRAA